MRMGSGLIYSALPIRLNIYVGKIYVKFPRVKKEKEKTMVIISLSLSHLNILNSAF